MAEYYTLVKRAVAPLRAAPAQQRFLIYNRAKHALLSQLKSMEPPIPDTLVQRESDALDQAIERLETEITSERVEEVSWPVSREKIGEAASPYPTLDHQGRLSAGPNPVFDEPLIEVGLIELPARQVALIGAILSDLPGNAPKSLRFALDSYRAEIRARGVQPILGLLVDMETVISASLSDDADLWLRPGVNEAVKAFRINHRVFVEHFPLSVDKQEMFSRLEMVDNAQIESIDLASHLKKIAEASKVAQSAGITTKEYVEVTDALTEFAKVIASIQSSSKFKEGAEDPVKAVKRTALLNALGFFERGYNLVGTTASLFATSEGQALLEALRNAVNSLSTHFKF